MIKHCILPTRRIRHLLPGSSTNHSRGDFPRIKEMNQGLQPVSKGISNILGPDSKLGSALKLNTEPSLEQQPASTKYDADIDESQGCAVTKSLTQHIQVSFRTNTKKSLDKPPETSKTVGKSPLTVPRLSLNKIQSPSGDVASEVPSHFSTPRDDFSQEPLSTLFKKINLPVVKGSVSIIDHSNPLCTSISPNLISFP